MVYINKQARGFIIKNKKIYPLKCNSHKTYNHISFFDYIGSEECKQEIARLVSRYFEEHQDDIYKLIETAQLAR